MSQRHSSEPSELADPFAIIACVVGAFSWYVLLTTPRRLMTLDRLDELVIGPGTCGIIAAVAFGLALYAVRRPGRYVWVAWLSLFANASLLVVVVVRLVRWL